jgi:hypothetical protein
MAFLMLLRRMGRGDVTAHGFRSSFRDWAHDLPVRGCRDGARAHRER